MHVMSKGREFSIGIFIVTLVMVAIMGATAEESSNLQSLLQEKDSKTGQEDVDYTSFFNSDSLNIDGALATFEANGGNIDEVVSDLNEQGAIQLADGLSNLNRKKAMDQLSEENKKKFLKGYFEGKEVDSLDKGITFAKNADGEDIIIVGDSFTSDLFITKETGSTVDSIGISESGVTVTKGETSLTTVQGTVNGMQVDGVTNGGGGNSFSVRADAGSTTIGADGTISFDNANAQASISQSSTFEKSVEATPLYPEKPTARFSAHIDKDGNVGILNTERSGVRITDSDGRVVDIAGTGAFGTKESIDTMNAGLGISTMTVDYGQKTITPTGKDGIVRFIPQEDGWKSVTTVTEFPTNCFGGNCEPIHRQIETGIGNTDSLLLDSDGALYSQRIHSEGTTSAFDNTQRIANSQGSQTNSNANCPTCGTGGSGGCASGNCGGGGGGAGGGAGGEGGQGGSQMQQIIQSIMESMQGLQGLGGQGGGSDGGSGGSPAGSQGGFGVPGDLETNPGGAYCVVTDEGVTNCPPGGCHLCTYASETQNEAGTGGSEETV